MRPSLEDTAYGACLGRAYLYIVSQLKNLALDDIHAALEFASSTQGVCDARRRLKHQALSLEPTDPESLGVSERALENCPPDR